MVEALMAMMILFVVLLGLLQTIILVNDANIRNAIRNEASKIAQEEMDNQRNLAASGIGSIVSSTVTVNRSFRNMTLPYTVANVVTPQGSSRRITMTISWSLKGQNYSYSAETLVRQ